MKIAAFGEIMLRLMVPEHKLLNQSDQLVSLYSGTGMNIVAQLSKWGYHCYLVSSVPKNNIGKAASSKVRSLGIDDQYINYQHDGIGLYFLETGYGARPSVVTYMGRKNSSFSLSKKEDYRIDEIVKKIDVLHICGIGLALNDDVRETAIAFVKKAKELGVLVCFDFNYRSSVWSNPSYQYAKSQYERMLPYCDIVFAGQKDAELILGIKEATMEETMRKMIDRYQIKVIAGTFRNGNDNERYYQGFLINDQGYYQSDSYKLEVYDRIGAGDGFAAGIIDGIIKKENPKKIVEYATASAVLAHTIYGDSPLVEKEDVERLLNHQQIDILR